jgi:hypothetical protein
LKQKSTLLQNCKYRLAMFSAILSLAIAGPAYSQVTPAAGYTPPDDTPSIKVGVVFYGNYTYTSAPQSTDSDGNKISPNSFDVTRSYLNFTGNINHRVQYRITPDVTRATVTGATASFNNSLVFRIKYAYMQFNLDDWSGSWKQTWIRMGANQTPLVDWEEGIYRYRFQGTTFSERVGRLTSSDFGVSFHTSFPKNYGEIHTGIYNGDGYTAAEANNRKAFQTRVTVRPLATSSSLTARGFRGTAFYDWDTYMKNDPRERLWFQGLFENAHLTAAVDWLDAKDQPNAAAAEIHGRGYSVWATPAFQEKNKGPELLLRWDSYTPSLANTSARQNTAIFGASYWFRHEGTSTASLLVDEEIVKFPGTATASQRRTIVHLLFNY